jgi:predicted nucleic acid-binding Zn ribbon protein
VPSAFGSPNSYRPEKREYNNNKNDILEFKYILMVLIRCPECGANTDLAAAYYNVEDAEVRCSGCKAKLTVTLKNGEIKKIETKGPGIG